MARQLSKVMVVGLGKVGELVARLLALEGFVVTGVDSRQPRGELPFPVVTADVTDPSSIGQLLEDHEAVVSCLPYHLNIHLAEAAHASHTHYFDLTEDVETTKAIQKLGETASGVMVPQSGLAPGFICIVGASLLADFDEVRSLRMRVGALPQHPTGLLGYAFNWSPEGVVNEYLNPCEVLRAGEKRLVPPMGQLEKIFVAGNELEAFTTSGGLGTMCDTYLGQIEDLNYKTLRYPGHCEQMRFFFRELRMEKRREEAGQILVNAKPPVNDDVVYVHASAEGRRDGELFREEFVRAYYPVEIDGQMWRAISWTTAASVCALVEMLAEGEMPEKGFVRQEDIGLDRFLATGFGKRFEGGKI